MCGGPAWRAVPGGFTRGDPRRALPAFKKDASGRGIRFSPRLALLRQNAFRGPRQVRPEPSVIRTCGGRIGWAPMARETPASPAVQGKCRFPRLTHLGGQMFSPTAGAGGGGGGGRGGSLRERGTWGRLLIVDRSPSPARCCATSWNRTATACRGASPAIRWPRWNWAGST